MLRQLALAATLTLAASATAGAETVIVQQIGNTFSPRDITIAVGDTVRWVHNGGSHSVTEGNDGTVNGNEAFHSWLLGGSTATFEVVFDAAFLAANPRPGDMYRYFCLPHFAMDMKGTVSVVTGTPWYSSFCDCPTVNAPCGNAGASGEGCANSSGAGATLTMDGSGSVSQNDTTLQATNLLPGQPALLYSADNAINGGAGIPFGDGLRCTGGNLLRHGVAFPDATGTANWGPGVSGGWGAGDTRNFQVWYRDPVGGPCSNGFNLTNGMTGNFGA